MKRHAYARYMIEIALEIERRRSNHAGLPPDVRARSSGHMEELQASDAALARDQDTNEGRAGTGYGAASAREG